MADGQDPALSGIHNEAGAALDGFVAEMRAICARDPDPATAFEAAHAPLARLLGNAALARAAAGWPVCRRENWLLFEDPDHGFVIDGLVKGPGQATSIHDHGPIWVLYGVLSGGEDIRHFKRTDTGAATEEGPARIEETGRSTVRPGVLDLVPPYAIHSEQAGDAGSVAVILRSARPDRVATGRFDAARGYWCIGPGIRQIPLKLARSPTAG